MPTATAPPEAPKNGPQGEAPEFTADAVHGLPPGPRTPRLLQSLIFMSPRQLPHGRRLQKKFGDVFTVNLIGFPSFVVVGDPALIKHTFTASPKVLHAGTGSPLISILGRYSLLSIDEDMHLNQRRLLLPPFHGERMKAYESVIEEITKQEIARWPEGEEFAALPAMQRITLRAILQTIYGAHGAHLHRLEELIPKTVDWGIRMVLIPFAQRDLGRFSPWGRFLHLRQKVYDEIDQLIDEARRDPELETRSDILALLVQATHEDGSPMTGEEIRDQLLTLMIAGHETTASSLAWALERLTRTPHAHARFAEEVDEGGSEYRDATIKEVMRTRPVVNFAARYVKEPFQLGKWVLPTGSRIALHPGLTHADERLFPDAGSFKPERFVGVKPDTYAWIPFGGGVRRCIGAAFAHMEMDVVLRTMFEQLEILPNATPDEPHRFRGVTFTPAKGARITVRRRVPLARLSQAQREVAAAV